MENHEISILIAEDDHGHASLIQRNLKRAGIVNSMRHFSDGKEVIDYLFGSNGRPRPKGDHLLLLLDIRMPKMDGVEVLRKIKADPELKKMPVIMVTTTDDPREVELCHALGCSSYLTKPVDYGRFIEMITQLGIYLKLVSLPLVRRQKSGTS